ncbi:TPA: type IV pilus biogenesis protein PilP [Serratia marcescens]
MPNVRIRLACGLFALLCVNAATLAEPVTQLPAAPLVTSSGTLPTAATTAFAQREAGRALNLGELEAIQAETVLFEAQLARAKAFSELQKNGYDRSLDRPFNPAPPAQDTHETKGAVDDMPPPKIVQITGMGKRFTALLMLSNGNQVTVQPGNHIPGSDYVVKSVTLNDVIVMKGQRTLSLAFSG